MKHKKIKNTINKEIMDGTTIIPTYTFNTHTFTTAGKIGPIGPTLDEVKNAYSTVPWAQNNNFLNMTKQGIQEWTVPVTEFYTIRAAGAKGGDGRDGKEGGKGLDISITTTLNKGEIIKILVGQKGINQPKYDGDRPWYFGGAGGGGGTFVVRDTKTPIIVAGGGGGAQPANFKVDKNNLIPLSELVTFCLAISTI